MYIYIHVCMCIYVFFHTESVLIPFMQMLHPTLMQCNRREEPNEITCSNPHVTKSATVNINGITMEFPQCIYHGLCPC